MDLTEGLLLALGAVNFALCLYLVWLFGRIREGLAQAEEVATTAEMTESARELIARVAAEIERVAREVSTDFEESEGRLSALERLVEERLAPGPRHAEPAPSVVDDATPLAEEPEAIGTTRTDDAADEPEPEDPAPQRHALGERGRRVRELRAQGNAPDAIAREMGLSGGEVECILSLADRLDVAARERVAGQTD